MAVFIWANPSQWDEQYATSTPNDPNVPSGYVLTYGSDGAIDRVIYPGNLNTGIQQYVAGINSGGFPAYTEDPAQAANPEGWINGVFTSKPGGSPQGG